MFSLNLRPWAGLSKADKKHGFVDNEKGGARSRLTKLKKKIAVGHVILSERKGRAGGTTPPPDIFW